MPKSNETSPFKGHVGEIWAKSLKARREQQAKAVGSTRVPIGKRGKR